MKRLLVLAKSERAPSVRYRWLCHKEKLESQGWQFLSLPLSSRPLLFQRALKAVKEAELVVIQRKLLPLWALSWLRARCRFLIFDFDDAIYVGSRRRMRRFFYFTYRADALFVGNFHLASLCPLEKVKFFPAALNVDSFPVAPHRGKKLKLVWLGSSSNLLYLSPWLEWLSKVCLPFSLTVICDRMEKFSFPFPCEHRQWYEGVERELSHYHIGLAPLWDGVWERGKCALKCFQYLSAGLCVLASPVGWQKEVLPKGVVRFVSSCEDLEKSLWELRSPQLRREVGEAGRVFVEQYFSQKVWGEWLVKELEEYRKKLGFSSR